MSERLVGYLNRLPRRGGRVFLGSRESIYFSFMELRRRAAARFQNPRLERITFHTIRHWKATMEYHKTKDILHVMQTLGHKNINNTLVYIKLEEALFGGPADQFYSAVAKGVDEARKLIEAGFEYVCDFEGVKLFRKRR